MKFSSYRTRFCKREIRNNTFSNTSIICTLLQDISTVINKHIKYDELLQQKENYTTSSNLHGLSPAKVNSINSLFHVLHEIQKSNYSIYLNSQTRHTNAGRKSAMSLQFEYADDLPCLAPLHLIECETARAASQIEN